MNQQMETLEEDDIFVLAFLEARGTDYRSRVISEIWDFEDNLIDTTHDFIQWLFPLPLEAPSQLSRPTLTGLGLRAIASSALAVSNIQKSQYWFLNFLERSDVWLKSYNHNHLRITRMIKNSSLIEGSNYSDRLFKTVAGIADRKNFKIDPKTIDHWQNARAL